MHHTGSEFKSNRNSSAGELFHHCFIRIGLYLVAVSVPFWLLINSSTQTMQQIKPIDRVSEHELDPAVFLAKYVETGTPVIIIRDEHALPNSKDVISSFVINCSDLTAPGIPSPATEAIKSLTSVQQQVLSFILNLLLGFELKSFMENREHVSIADIHRVATSKISLKVSISKLVDWLPHRTRRVIELFSRPPYFADAAFSPYLVKGRCGVDVQNVRQENQLISMARQKRDPTVNEKGVALFWGGIDSSYYPMHRDALNGDMFMDVLSGCKEFVIVHPDERDKLKSIPIPIGEAFEDDLFTLSTDKVKSMMLRGTFNRHINKAWKGTISAGETLYMSAKSLHEARNNCPSTIALNHRPWLGKTFRRT